MGRRLRISHEHGFTIVEVMVAMVILLIGLAGTLTLLDQANASTTTTKSREGAVALSRELVEAARSQAYDQLTQGNVVAAIRARTGFAGSTVTGSGWEIKRRNITYTMAVGVCSVDDPNDNFGVRDSSFCAGDGTTTAAQCMTALGRAGDISGAGSATGAQVGDCGIDLDRDGRVDNLTLGDVSGCTGTCAGGGTLDTNPDDYKRVVTLVRWTNGTGSHFVLQSTSLPYPGLSGAPRVTSLTVTNAPGNLVSSSSQTNVGLSAVTNRRATSVGWALDGTPTGTAAASGTAGTAWTITWPLGTAACAPPTNGTSPNSGEVLDGAVVFGTKAVDNYGQAGPTKAETITLNRCAPYKPADPTVARIGGSGVEAVWNPNRERDIEGYQLFRVQGTGSANAVCTRSRALACTDASFPSSGTWDYYVVPYDRDTSNAFRPGASSTKISLNLSNTPPSAPAGALTGSRLSASSTSISWLASPGDIDGTIKGYRIYRDGTSLNNRYGSLLAANATSYTDSAATEGHTYYVAAVDNNDAESAKTAGVDIP